MRIIHIISEEAATKVQGTNCGNCIWRKGAETKLVGPDELNVQGGIVSTNSEDIKNAKISDLVTLPGKGTTKKSFFCKHKKVKQWVTERMCCIYWNAPGVYRSFGKMSVK